MNLKNAIREAASEREKQQSQQTVKPQSSKAVKQENSEAVTPEEQGIEYAALTIRVPKKSRVHWLVSAKKENTTLTAAITEALNARFGEATE